MCILLPPGGSIQKQPWTSQNPSSIPVVSMFQGSPCSVHHITAGTPLLSSLVALHKREPGQALSGLGPFHGGSQLICGVHLTNAHGVPSRALPQNLPGDSALTKSNCCPGGHMGRSVLGPAAHPVNPHSLPMDTCTQDTASPWQATAVSPSAGQLNSGPLPRPLRLLPAQPRAGQHPPSLQHRVLREQGTPTTLTSPAAAGTEWAKAL